MLSLGVRVRLFDDCSSRRLGRKIITFAKINVFHCSVYFFFFVCLPTVCVCDDTGTEWFRDYAQDTIVPSFLGVVLPVPVSGATHEGRAMGPQHNKLPIL